MPTMSLKPRKVDFQETWANLKETVSAVVGVRSVDRSVWNMRFSDVYALCVAHPEPLADRLYDETRAFLEEHVGGLLQRVRGHTPLDSDDHTDGLLDRYVDAWQEYSQGVAYLNSLYSYLNLQHVKRQKVSDAEIIYGTASIADGETDGRQLEVGELGLVIWERVLIKPLEGALSRRIVGGLAAARDQRTPLAHADALRRTVASTAEVQAFRQRAPLRLYQSLVLEPYLKEAATHHGEVASNLLQEGDVSHYMSGVLEGLERENALARRFLHPSSAEAVRECFEKAAVAAHLPALHAECERLLREERRSDLARLFVLLRPLGAAALRPLVDAAHAQAAAHGRALLADKHDKDEAHVHFVQSVLAMHGKYTELFEKVFSGTQSFVGALDKACSEVVNARPAGGEAPAAPELLARYCDGLLRKRGASETEADERLAAAIVVFKYIDDKDVFQKYYARALARRLIHQLSASMEQEEAMINRLKTACGYEFTNKLHRMFTDVAVSADLNAKFQRHLRERNEQGGATVSVQVLQAGAWPLGGAMAPLQPPPQLEKPARLFEQFYRASFSGRRLAWLHHLCTGELRTRYTPRMYHLTATTPQCAVLLAFERVDSRNAPELRDELQLDADAWTRHVKPLLEAGLLSSDSGDCDGEIRLNLTFTSKRSKIRLTCASLPANAAQGSATGSASEPQTESATCDDDRKMYLQAALVRIMKQRRVLRHNELIQEVVLQARGLFAPSVAMIKKCIESLIDKQYLERAPGRLDTYSYLA